MSFEIRLLIGQFVKWIVVSVLGWSGPQGLITRIILKYVLKKGWIELKDLYIHWKVKQEFKDKVEQYESVIKNPNSTAEDIKNSFHDLLNK